MFSKDDNDYPFFVRFCDVGGGAKFSGDAESSPSVTLHYEAEMKTEAFEDYDRLDSSDIILQALNEQWGYEPSNSSYSPTGRWFTQSVKVMKVPGRNLYIILVFRLQDV